MKYSDKNIGKLVVGNYRFATVFRKFGIDFYCRGGRTLRDVCRENKIEIAYVVDLLVASELEHYDEGSDFDKYSLTKLVDFIVENHHQYVKEAIPPLIDSTSKVSREHGEQFPEVIEIAKQFMSLAEELTNHLEKEETVLFPYIKNLEASALKRLPSPQSIFGSVSNPISVMMLEHKDGTDIFDIIRKLSNNFTPPLLASNTYKVSLQKLNEFEEEMHKHVHLENNILFPKALDLERSFSMIPKN
jgi:regulator of cell morphogenesis and NO signaling